jgi:hypothetical protein
LAGVAIRRVEPNWMTDESKRQPGESEFDYRQRVRDKQAAEKNTETTAFSEKYQPAMETIADECAKQIVDVLTGLVGATKVSDVISTTNSAAIAQRAVIAESKNGRVKFDLTLIVSKLPTSGEQPLDKATYSLILMGRGGFTGIPEEIKGVTNVNGNGPSRPTLDLKDFTGQIRKAAHLDD